MNKILMIALFTASLTTANSLSDLKQSATSAKPRDIAESMAQLEAITFFDAIDTALKEVPRIVEVRNNSYVLHMGFFKTRTFHNLDSIGMARYGASVEMAKALAVENYGSRKYMAFRAAYLRSVLRNVTFPSFIQDEVIDAIMTDLHVKELPEYQQALKEKAESARRVTPEDSAKADMILKAFQELY